MKDEDKVTSLGLSKGLVDAGIVVESYFGSKDRGYIFSTVKGFTMDCVPRPLACELLDILPVEAEVCKCSYGFLSGIPLEVYESWSAGTAADALAKMAMWLKAEGLLEQPKEGSR